LHGNVPDKAAIAIVLVDVINDFEFDGGEALLEFAAMVAPEICALARAGRAAGIPIIYANDNRGKWRSDFRAVLSRCLGEGCKGREIVKQFVPCETDYFVLKTKNSAFFGTSLELLLQHLGTEKLIVGGFATDRCLLFTALDAYLRDYQLFVPMDCTAAEDEESAARALRLLERSAGADTRPWRELTSTGPIAPKLAYDELASGM
jgi:nicotinamidase-related amidase